MSSKLPNEDAFHEPTTLSAPVDGSLCQTLIARCWGGQLGAW
jgi:hypothetical protein